MTLAEFLPRLGNAALQGLVFLGLIWLACRFVKSLKPATRQWLWWLGSLKLILGLVWIAPVALPLLPAAEADRASIQQFAPVLGQASGLSRSPAPDAISTVPMILLSLWALGILLLITRSMGEALRLRTILKRAQPADDSLSGADLRMLALEMGLSSPPRLVVSGGITTPLLALPYRPTIVVPQDFETSLTDEERRMALAHELAHLRRRDLWASIVPSLARTLFFFLPPAWFAAREFTADAEAACDEEALRATGGDPKGYCELLLKMVTRDHKAIAVPALGATHRFHTLKRRIEIMREGPTSAGRPALAALAIVAVLAIPFQVTAQQGATAQGILLNAGLEEGRSAPKGWVTGQAIRGVKYVWDRQVAHSGKASLSIDKSIDTYFPISEWNQTIAYDGKAKKLDLSAYVKAKNVTKSILTVQFLAKDGLLGYQWAAYIGSPDEDPKPINHEWRLYQGTVEIPKETHEVQISLQTYGPGTVWFDDVQAHYHD